MFLTLYESNIFCVKIYVTNFCSMYESKQIVQNVFTFLTILLQRSQLQLFCPKGKDELAKQYYLFIKFHFRLAQVKQKQALEVSYNIFVKTGSYPAEIRRAVIERVCLNMLRVVHKSTVIEFFTDHIVEIKGLIESKLSKVNLFDHTSSYKTCFLKYM